MSMEGFFRANGRNFRVILDKSNIGFPRDHADFLEPGIRGKEGRESVFGNPRGNVLHKENRVWRNVLGGCIVRGVS